MADRVFMPPPQAGAAMSRGLMQAGYAAPRVGAPSPSPSPSPSPTLASNPSPAVAVLAERQRALTDQFQAAQAQKRKLWAELEKVERDLTALRASIDALNFAGSVCVNNRPS